MNAFKIIVLLASVVSCAAQQPEEEKTMYLYVNGNRLEAELAKTEAAAALAGRLLRGDVTYRADDYGGFEKVGAPGFPLPADDRQIRAQPGDIMLYQSSSIVIFYGGNSWSYTPLATIRGKTAVQLKTLLGSGTQQITFSLK